MRAPGGARCYLRYVMKGAHSNRGTSPVIALGFEAWALLCGGLLVLAAMALMLAPSPAAAGPLFGPIGADSNNRSCGGGGAVSAGGYRANWTTDAHAGSRCDWNLPSQGAGTRVSTVGFSWQTGNTNGSNANNRFIQFGVAGSSGFQSLLWGSLGTPQIGYAFDVSAQNVGIAATRHLMNALSSNYGANPAQSTGYTQTTGLQYVYEDLYPPTVDYFNTVGTPTVNGWVTGPVRVNVQTSDNAYFQGNSHIWVDGGGGSFSWVTNTCAPNPAACYSAIQQDLNPGPDGYHVAYARRDSGGGWADGLAAIGFNSDLTAPSVPTVTAPGYTPGTWSAESVTLNASSHDNVNGTGSGIAGYTWSSGQSGASAAISAEGYHFVQALANDNVGRQSGYSTSTTVMIDRTPPSVPAIGGAPADGVWSNAPGGVPLTVGTSSDNLSGVEPATGYEYRYRHSLDGVVYGDWTGWVSGTAFTVTTDGWTQFQARSRDRAGNYSERGDAFVQLDREPPGSSLSSATLGAVPIEWVIDGETFSEDPGWVSPEGPVRVQVAAGGSEDDLSGLHPETPYEVARIDGAGTCAAATGWSAASGMDIDDEGLFAVCLRAVDLAGNRSDPVTAPVRIDRTSPRMPMVTGDSPTWLQGTRAAITVYAPSVDDPGDCAQQLDPTCAATDSATTVSGVHHYEYQASLNGGAFGAPQQIGPSGRFLLDAGQWSIQVRSVDGAGNVSGWTTAVVLRLAQATRSLVHSWGSGSLESALCRLPSVDHAANVPVDCEAFPVGGPDWNPDHRN